MNLTAGNPKHNGRKNVKRVMIVRYFQESSPGVRKNLCMTALDPEQAQTVLYAIEQPLEHRFPYAEQLHKFLVEQIKKCGGNKFIWHKLQVSSVLRTQSGLIMESRPPLPGRVCEMLVYACINEYELERRKMLAELTRFIAGEKVGICAYEFKVQYKVDT